LEPTRVLIADDNPSFREGLNALLLSAPDLEVVGEAEDSEKAVSIAAELQPDVVLMDLNMPGRGGIEATRQILNTSPHVSVLVISMFEDDDSVFAALQAGARGYLLKGAPKAEILRAIGAVTSGEAIFGPTIARRLMDYFATPRPKSAPPEAFPELTEREREILSFVAQHQTNPEIARRLHLSQKTVRNHVSNIFAKLQVADRAQAIIRAREAGLGQDNL
jgi:DNA-binding NarL/FixJ family response regulator